MKKSQTWLLLNKWAAALPNYMNSKRVRNFIGVIKHKRRINGPNSPWEVRADTPDPRNWSWDKLQKKAKKKVK